MCGVPKILCDIIFAICNWIRKHRKLKFTVSYRYSQETFKTLKNPPQGRNGGFLHPSESINFFLQFFCQNSSTIRSLCSIIIPKSAIWRPKPSNSSIYTSIISSFGIGEVAERNKNCRYCVILQRCWILKEWNVFKKIYLKNFFLRKSNKHES